MQRVARRAGISKGLIWHYFTGRADLMEATARVTAAAVRDHLAGMLDLTAPVPEVIRAAVRYAAALSVTHRAQLVALDHIVHNLRHADGTPRLTLDFYEETYRAQESLLRRGQAEGTLRDFDTRVMAVSYTGTIDMMLGYLRLHPDVDPEYYADQLATILLDGVRRP